MEAEKAVLLDEILGGGVFAGADGAADADEHCGDRDAVLFGAAGYQMSSGRSEAVNVRAAWRPDAIRINRAWNDSPLRHRASSFTSRETAQHYFGPRA